MATTGLVEQARGLTPDQRNSFVAAFLGWTMDAFDYFIVVLVYSEIARDFGVSLTTMAFLTTATLAMRPVGAFVFGRWADSKGRRVPLMVDVAFYSVVGFACAFAPNYAVLLVLRLLYGIGMGGEWGLGAALAMEKIPVEKRGFFSGVLQQGYPVGYLLAAIAFFAIVPTFGWRGLFIAAAAPALLALFIRMRVKESEAWERTHERQTQNRVGFRDVFFKRDVLRRFVYLVVLMAAFNFMSHGTQDFFPTFLEDDFDASSNTVVIVAIIYNIGALIGGMYFGALSQRFGRRKTIILCAAVALPVVPLFAFSPTLGLITLGAFLMQIFVQGAWGVIPAHLSELSPDEVRGFYPGVTYQLGNLLAALNLPIQTSLADSHSGGFALAAVIIPTLVIVIVLTAVGSERHSADFGSGETSEAAEAPRGGRFSRKDTTTAKLPSG
jgi:SHS family lactate transporter-like MFS transporter